MSVLALPSAFALAIKLWLILSAWSALKNIHRDLFWFALALTLMNAAELLMFSYLDRVQDAYPLMLTYYSATFVVAGTFLGLALGYLGERANALRIATYVLCGVFALAAAIPGVIIVGIQPLGSYGLTRIAGPYYWLFQMFIPFCLILGMALFTNTALYSEITLSRKRAKILLISLSPFVISVISIIALMTIGFIVSATAIVSLTITIFLVMLVWTEEKTNLFVLFSYTPFTKENKLRKRFNLLIRDTIIGGPDEVSFRSKRQEFENLLIDAALHANGNQVTKTARKLGITPVTIYRKLKSEK